ncbi:MAG: peptidoglycan-binding protein [Polyangiaceae bacterium]|nr:peptidoglycan-binding protein [Polyangiaceae bacterium]
MRRTFGQRGANAVETSGTRRRHERRAADLFFADLMGWSEPRQSPPTRSPRGWAPVESGPPRTFRAARFGGNAELLQILNGTRELQNKNPDMTGADIRIVQQALVDLGYVLPSLGVDGIYGTETEAAVKKFQTEQRTINPAFLIDGIVGDQTMGRLDEIFQVLDRPVGARTTAPTDPSTGGTFQPGRITYDIGPRTVLGVSLNVRGTIFYPATAGGSNMPFDTTGGATQPIVFLAHGNHGTFHDPANRSNEDCFTSPGWLPIANHDGYSYLQEALAGLGIISVSVDCNDTNCQGLSPTNIRRRSGLIVESIRHVISLAAAASGSVLEGHVDFSKTGLLGHSRGGEAVLVVPGDVAAAGLSTVQIKAVLSLAPTDAGTLSVMPTGFAYLVLLPAGDGDVSSNEGAGFYDRITPSPFKTQLYVHRTNHNRFNREWVNDDFPAPLISRTEHERLLKVYTCGLFRHVLKGVNFLDLLLGKTEVSGVSNVDIFVSAEQSAALTIDDHQDVPLAPATRTSTNTLGGATTISPTVSAFEIPLSQPGVPPDNTFFGATRGMIASTSVAYGTYRSALASPTNITNREVWIRACEVFNNPSVPATATEFQVGVEDAAGERCFVPSGRIARPFDRTAVDSDTKSMLETFRFAQSSFSLARPGVDVTRIRAIVIRLNGVVSRKIAFDQLQLV